jgi:hypothetical protein
MQSIHEQLEGLRRALPAAKFRLDEPANPAGEWFLDIVCKGKGFIVQWREGGPFGLSSMDRDTGIGQKADEVHPTLEAVAARLIQLLDTGGRTEPPAEVTLRELRAERSFS